MTPDDSPVVLAIPELTLVKNAAQGA
jgi:hypothetical protein